MSGGHRLCADRSGAKTGGILMAGRKPKPTALKKLEGNPGKRKMKETRPKSYPKLKNYKPSKFMLETSHYDKAKADRAVKFIENLCHIKGNLKLCAALLQSS